MALAAGRPGRLVKWQITAIKSSGYNGYLRQVVRALARVFVWLRSFSQSVIELYGLRRGGRGQVALTDRLRVRRAGAAITIHKYMQCTQTPHWLNVSPG